MRRRSRIFGQARVARIRCVSVARTVHGADRQAEGFDAAALQVEHDVGVAGRHGLCSGLPQLAGEQLSGIGHIGRGFDRPVEGAAQHLGTQRVAVVVGPNVAQQCAGVGGHFAHDRVALVRNHLADTVSVQATFDLVVLHEAQGLPIGRRESAGCAVARGRLEAHLVAQCAGKGTVECLEIAAKI